MDYLFPYQDQLLYPQIQEARQFREKKRSSLSKKLSSLKALTEISVTGLNFLEDTVRIGNPNDLTSTEQEILEKDIETLRPWRKGPLELFGIPIDSEWKSNLKWNRIVPHISSLAGKVVADIGCNNGYYMFRMIPQQPRLVIGFDPTIHYLDQFNFLQFFAHQSPLHFELLGIEHISFFPQFFDTIFCLGVLYHHPDPIGMLRGMCQALKPGGELIIESQGIPGEDSVALFPEERYAKVPNTWFVPTASCLKHWIKRAGFEKVELFGSFQLTSEEQRTTKDAPYQSLKDFLDPKDPTRTVEGYLAPIRIYAKAKKKKE